MLTCRSCRNSRCYQDGYSVGLRCERFHIVLCSPNNAHSDQAQQQYDKQLALRANTCPDYDKDA